MRFLRRLAPALLVLGCAGSGLADTARAAFPGGNGLIYHEGSATPRGILYTVSAGSREVARLRPGGPLADPALSPQGGQVAFGRGGDVWVAFADGTGARQVTAGPEADRAPAWAPGGGQLAFARGPDGRRDVFTVRPDGTLARQITYGVADEHSAAWAATGRVAYVYERRKGDGDIRSLDPAAGAAFAKLTSGRADDQSPDWSPDGTQIAFTRTRRGRTEVWTMRSDGSRERQRTRLDRDAATPVFSPDGRRLVFSAGRPGKRRLYVLKLGRDVKATPRPITAERADARRPDWQTRGLDPVIGTAGDIACDPTDPEFTDGTGTPGRCHQRRTSDQLLNLDLAAVLMLGDMQYEAPRPEAIAASYGPTWGRLKPITWPVVGNHEYRDDNATGYFEYFNGAGNQNGRAGTRGQGWYSFDLGRWHVIALNSQCSHPPRNPTAVECAAGSPQERWLRADLAANSRQCTLAFFHHPLFSSTAVNAEPMRPIWRALYEGGADVILNGHDHTYTRFAPQTPDGAVDPVRGIRQFIVGTGGHSHQRSAARVVNAEAQNLTDYGIMRMILRPASYDWQFMADTGAVTDAGTGACH